MLSFSWWWSQLSSSKGLCHRAQEGIWGRAPVDFRWLDPESHVCLWIELLAFCAIVCLKWTPKNSSRGEVGYFWEHCKQLRAVVPWGHPLQLEWCLPVVPFPNLLRMAQGDRVGPAQIVQASDPVVKFPWWCGCFVVPRILLDNTSKDLSKESG